MREVVPGRADRGIWTLVLLTLAVCVLAFAAPAFASSSPAPATASPAASEAAGPASPAAAVTSPAPADAASPAADPAPILSCSIDRPAMFFGDTVSVGGSLTPPSGGGQLVDITLNGDVVATATVDAAAQWSATFVARRSGDVVATLHDDPTVASDPQTLSVKPRASISHGTLVPFLASRFVVKVAPSAYDGVVVIKVVHRRVTVGAYKARVKAGRATFSIPLRGVDAFTLKVIVPAARGLSGRSFQVKVAVRAKTLSAGSRGLYVKGMLTALRRLRFRVPNVGTSFTTQVKDSVMAFQKAYRLSRTYVFNTACWRKIDRAKIIKPRYSSPSRHLEVDKTRQILMVVKGGKAYGIICVSTGATGNTPEGAKRIQQKHSYTTSGFGGILVRTMGFQGDFAIHGYSPVPPYPASHGCVREPIWACYWVYDNSFVGERLYVYH